jgi:hypothetical protein
MRRPWQDANAYLVETADRTFDPADSENVGETPKMSVAEAIKVAQLAQAKAARPAAGKAVRWGPPLEGYEEYGPALAEDPQIAELRESILAKLARLHERDEEEKLAAGWTRHGDAWVPPGFVPAWEAMAPAGSGDEEG